MKKYLLILIAAATLGGCVSQSYKLSANDIQYIEDPRSGLCFAVVNVHSRHQQVGMTTVDCSDIKSLLSLDTTADTNNQGKQVAEELRTGKNYYNTTLSFSSF